MQTPCEDRIVSEWCWVCAVEDSVRLGLNDRDMTGTLHTWACVWAGRLWLQNVASNDSHRPCPFTPTKGGVAHLEAHLVTFSEKQSKSPAPIIRDDQRGQIRHPGERGWGQQIQHLWAEVASSSEHTWNQWLLPPIFQRRHGPSSARTVIAKSHTLTQQKMFSRFRRLHVWGQSVQGGFLLGLSSWCGCRLLRQCPLLVLLWVCAHTCALLGRTLVILEQDPPPWTSF